MSRIFKYEPLCVRPRYTMIQIIIIQKLYVTKLGNKDWGKDPLLAIRTYICKEFFKFSAITVKMRPGINNITKMRSLYLLYLHRETSKCKGIFLKSISRIWIKISQCRGTIVTSFYTVGLSEIWKLTIKHFGKLTVS